MLASPSAMCNSAFVNARTRTTRSNRPAVFACHQRAFGTRLSSLALRVGVYKPACSCPVVAMVKNGDLEVRECERWCHTTARWRAGDRHGTPVLSPPSGAQRSRMRDMANAAKA